MSLTFSHNLQIIMIYVYSDAATCVTTTILCSTDVLGANFLACISEETNNSLEAYFRAPKKSVHTVSDVKKGKLIDKR